MKILIDSYKLFDKNYNFIKTLIQNLKKNELCEVTLLCATQSEKNELVKSNQFYDFEIKIFDDNLEEYDFYLSAMNDKPDCISNYSNIISIALLVDLIYRAESIEESFATIRENMRFFRLYDYYISPYNYGTSVYNNILELDIKKQIILDLYNFDKNYDINQETIFRKSVCTKKFSDLLIEKLIAINNLKHRKPLVSIVTITFNLIKNNRDKTIIECLDSVKNQSYPNIEHLIIDGGSTDGTLELIKSYDTENKLKIYSEKDEGIYDAMNKGIEKASGKYIVFLNSDDFYCRDNAILEAVELLEKKELDYLFGDAKAMTEDGKETFWKADINKLPYAMNYCHQTLFVKTEVMRKLGNFDLSYKISSDSDIMIKLYSNNYKYDILRNPYIMYRLGGLSSEQSNQSKLDHSESFYINIGKKIGLTRKECEEVWAMRFLQLYPLKHQIYILRKLSRCFDTDDILLYLVLNNQNISLKQALKRIKQIVLTKIKNILRGGK